MAQGRGNAVMFSLKDRQASFLSFFPEHGAGQFWCSEASSDDPKLTSVTGACWVPIISSTRAETQWEGKNSFPTNFANLGESQLACPKTRAS